MSPVVIEIGYCTAIRYDNAVKSPFSTQYLHQQTVASTAGITFKTVVSAHHFFHFPFFHQRFERRQVSFIQITRLYILRIKRVTVPLRPRMYGKVLGTGMQFVILSIGRPLQTFYYHHSHPACQIRVFTVCLDAPAPTRVTIDVHSGSPHGQALIAFTAILGCVVGILRACLVRHGIEHFIHHFRVERCRHTYRLGKDRSQACPGNTVQRLIPPVIRFYTQSFHGTRTIHHKMRFLFQRKFLHQKFRPPFRG